MQDKRLSFELPSQDEVATWIRLLSNFSMKAATAEATSLYDKATTNDQKSVEHSKASTTKEVEINLTL